MSNDKLIVKKPRRGRKSRSAGRAGSAVEAELRSEDLSRGPSFIVVSTLRASPKEFHFRWLLFLLLYDIRCAQVRRYALHCARGPLGDANGPKDRLALFANLRESCSYLSSPCIM